MVAINPLRSVYGKSWSYKLYLRPDAGAYLISLIPAGHFILQEHGEELAIGHLAIYRLAITDFQGIQNAGQALGTKVTAYHLVCIGTPFNGIAWCSRAGNGHRWYGYFRILW